MRKEDNMTLSIQDILTFISQSETEAEPPLQLVMANRTPNVSQVVLIDTRCIPFSCEIKREM